MVSLALPPADHLLIERDRGQFVPSRRRRMMANVRAERLLKIPAEPSPELRIPTAAAQTRIVSVARIRLDSRKSVRPFKWMFGWSRRRRDKNATCGGIVDWCALSPLWAPSPASPAGLFLGRALKAFHGVRPGLPFDLELARAGLAADEGEAQEVEGFRLAEPAPLAALRRKASELDEPSLLGI